MRLTIVARFNYGQKESTRQMSSFLRAKKPSTSGMKGMSLWLESKWLTRTGEPFLRMLKRVRVVCVITSVGSPSRGAAHTL